MHPADSDRGTPVSATVELGVVGKPHGVRGAVKARLHNARSKALDGGAAATLKLPDGRELSQTLRVVGRGTEHVILELDGVVDREGAEALRGATIVVDRATLATPEEQDGGYYCHDLIGCEVRDEVGRSMGRVAGVFEAGASDVLVARQGARERYLPLVPEWVEAVDLEGRVILLSCRADDWESWEI